jgi:hypothetical protein
LSLRIIVEAHYGRLRATSPDEGYGSTTFTVALSPVGV